MHDICQITVVIMVPSPLTVRWQEYYCTDGLSQRFALEYWDVSKLAYPAFSAPSPIERSYQHTITSWFDLLKNLRRVPTNTILISDVHFTYKNWSFHWLVSRFIKHCIYIDLWSYTILQALTQQVSRHSDECNYVQVKKNSVKYFLYKSDLIKLCAKFLKYGKSFEFEREVQMVKNLRDAKRYYRERNACTNLYKMHYFYTQPGHKYSINHPDYEKYLAIKNAPSVINDRYVVYIDQYFPSHPDLQEAEPNTNWDALKISFYASINRFFDLIEKQLNCRVIIAAHPVADYHEQNPFNGREIIWYQTAELIKDSIAVCLHYSNSSAFVAFFDKPFVLVDCESCHGSMSFETHIQQYASALNVNICDMNSVLDVSHVFHPLQSQIRDKFLSNFITSKISKRNVELMAAYIKEIAKDELL